MSNQAKDQPTDSSAGRLVLSHHRDGRQQGWSIVTGDRFVVGCTRDNFVPDFSLAVDSKVLSRDALVVHGPPGLWQAEVRNDANAVLEPSIGQRQDIVAGRRVALNDGDRIRLPGDEADSDAAAHWIHVDISDASIESGVAVPALTRVPLSLAGGVKLDLNDLQRTTITALCIRYLKTASDGATRGSTTAEIAEMLERVPKDRGGGTLSSNAIDERLKTIRFKILEVTNVWIEGDPTGGETINRQLARWLHARGALGDLDVDLADEMVDWA